MNLKSLHKTLKIKEPINFESLLMLEGITQRERTSLSEKSKKEMLATLDLIIRKTIDMRKKEGVSIKKDITASLSVINKDAVKIKTLSKKVVEDKKEMSESPPESYNRW